ncbi:ligand-binding sensor domain-containing diguanylate cyclase [Oceanisphaera sp. W20_SRM_FM3]|uniref:ligand-binding sensor domain-containing diguanylate cyclase n=1 Tax=Oceanisphaera sp. W20_SRM_FM3 TaxID=3240267 RepID=UPI003F956BD0
MLLVNGHAAYYLTLQSTLRVVMLFNGMRYAKMYNVILILCLLFSSFLIQAKTTALSHYYQDTWTTQDGLPNNTIHSINQTAEGYLWFATWEGVARYNGHNFRIFSSGDESGLHGSAVRGLTTDDKGLWVAGAKGGLSYYQDNNWSPQPKFKRMLNQVLVDSTELLWVATDGEGLYARRGNTIIAHFDQNQGLPSDYVTRLVEDKAGRIWVGTKQGLVWIKDNKVQAVPELSGVPISALLLNKQGQLLIGTAAGLYQAEQTLVTQIYPELANNSITSLLEDDQHHLWLGTAEHGLLRMSELGLEQLTVAQGLSGTQVISLFQDRERSIWVGTHAGLMRLRDVPFISFTEQDGLASNYVRTVLAHSDGSVWVGGSAGLTQIKDEQFNSPALIMPDGLAPSISSLAEGPSGELWLGTFTHGLLRVERGQVTHSYNITDGLSANEVRSLIVEPDGHHWLGTSAGLKRLINGRIEHYETTEPLLNDFILSLHKAVNGDVWVGAREGAAIIRDGQVTLVDLSSLGDVEYVFGFHSEPNGEYVWLTTDMGLIRYRYKDQSLSLIGKKQGLPIDKIFETIEDNNGDLWLTSNLGMTRISLAAAHRVADGEQDSLKFEQFNERDGMASSQTHGSSSPGLMLDKNGYIWVATARGVTRMAPERLAKFSHANLPVILEELKVSGTTVPLQPELVLPPGRERVQFQFAGLGFVMPERIEYRTLLEGFDEDWVLRGAENRAEYTNLPPGDYVFRVAAGYSYKDWDEQEARVSFTVLPFIWQLPFFWGIIASLALVSLWLLSRLRLQLLISRSQELARQVAEKTQELEFQAQEFERQARIDSLTGLPNRRAFDEGLIAAFARAKRSGKPVTLVVIDIDHFKHVNDTWSHGVGDQVLKIVGSIIRKEVREVDLPARWGGEEFTLLLADTCLTDAQPICERIRLAVMNHDYSHIDAKFRLTISLGLAQSNYLIDQDTLLANADLALYQAKHYGRNRIVAFTDIKI